MKYLKKFEDIKVPINVGDTILGGRFKNKKIVVKKIGKNKKGDITVNDKPLLKFRIIKENIVTTKDIEEYLIYVKDEGFVIDIDEQETIESKYVIVKIFKGESEFEWRKPYISEMQPFNLDDVKSDLMPLLIENENIFNFVKIIYNERKDIGYKSKDIESLDEFSNFETNDEILKVEVYMKYNKKEED